MDGGFYFACDHGKHRNAQRYNLAILLIAVMITIILIAVIITIILISVIIATCHVSRV